MTEMTKAELTDELARLLAEEPTQEVRDKAESLKTAFYKLHRADNEAARAAFEGPEEEFVAPEDAQEIRFKELYNDYRKRRNEHSEAQEKSREENLAVRLQIIEELKALVNSDETLGQTFNAFRELQQRWKDAGPVPATAMKDLWETYHLHVENFYNYVKINKELRDLDLRKNLEAKGALVEAAEAIQTEGSAVEALRKLQELHDQWRETGPVPMEVKDALWERFKEASVRINKAHQDYFDNLKQEQTANLEKKEALCERVESLAANTYTSRKEWDTASEEILEAQKQWRAIGFAPKKDNAKIYERFRRACDVFFGRKREFFAGAKGEMDANLTLKNQLVAAAEALSESEEWKEASETLVELQKKWKEVGPVSRRHSDIVWKKFRAAADKFFERKAAHFAEQGGGQSENLEKKQALIAELNAVTETSFEGIKEFQRRWSEIGHVPFKQKEALGAEYKRAMDRLFDMVRGSRPAGGGGARSGGSDSSRVTRLKAEIATLENNIGFFGTSKGAEALRKGVEEKIERLRRELAQIKG